VLTVCVISLIPTGLKLSKVTILMKKLSLLLAAMIFSWTITLVACSAPTPPVNVNAEGIAVKGYDTVAYFTEGKPVKGKKEIQYEWQGARWFFSTEQHLNMFRENPEKYAPQYGGY